MGNTLDHHVIAYQGDNVYDFDNHLQLNWYPKRILNLTPHRGSLLELGLGHGVTTQAFAPHFTRHLVLDASPAVIGNFRSRFPESSVEIIETYFESFQTDERFEVIVFGYVLEHVDDPVLILRHFKQFLKQGGSLFATVPNAEVLNRRLGHIAGLLPDLQEMSDNDRLLGHQRYYTRDTFIRDLSSAGYEVVRLEGIYLKPVTSRQMISLGFPQSILQAFCEVAIPYPELSCGMLAELKPATQ